MAKERSNFFMDPSMGMAGAAGAAGIVTVLKYILITLVGGVALGAIGGFIYAGIKYPNPNKKALFTAKQKIIFMVIGVISVALIVFAFAKKPKDNGDMMVDGSISAGMSDGENGELAEGDAETAEGEAEAAQGDAEAAQGDAEAGDGEETDTESTADEETSSESDSSSSDTVSGGTATGGSTTNGGGGKVIIGGGGGVAIARPMM